MAEDTQEQKKKKQYHQQISLKDYLAEKEKQAKKKSIRLPLPVTIVLITPFLLVFCFGLFYLPWLGHLVATGDPKLEKEVTGVSYDQLMRKDKKSKKKSNKSKREKK